MTASIEIRRAEANELPRVAEFVAAAGLPLAGFLDAGFVLVAELDQAVVGVAALEDHHDDDGRAFLLRSVAVAPEHRGSGIGQALTAAALDEVDRQQAPVALLTETAEHYFPRFGFRPVPREALPTVLTNSEEFRGACAVSAHALLRTSFAGQTRPGRPIES